MTLAEAQALYPNLSAFKAPNSGKLIYHRPITKREFDIIVRLSPGADLSFAAEEFILKEIVVFPGVSELETLTNQDIQSLAEVIVEKSGFYNIEDFVNSVRYYRESNKILSEQALIFIAKAFPVYKIEELENMGSKDIARLLALAEDMIGVLFPLPGDEPEQEVPKQSLGQVLQGPMTDEQKAIQRRGIEASQEALKQLKARGK